jgi:hypothetical protein
MSSRETLLILPKKRKYLRVSFAAMAHLTEGLSHSALLMLKVENSLICLVGT